MMVRQTTYGALAADLREAILRGEFAHGARLPTEAELAVRRLVSRQTVRRAMQDLVSEGLVFRVPGRGTYAVENGAGYLRHFGSVEDLMSLSVDTLCEIVEPLAPVVDAHLAAMLDTSDDRVHTVSFVRHHADVPFCHTRVALPSPVGELLRGEAALRRRGRRSTVTIIGLLDAVLDSPIREAEQTVRAASCTADVAAHLAVPVDAPVLRIERLYRDGTGRPVEFALSHFDPAHYAYRTRLRRSPG